MNKLKMRLETISSQIDNLVDRIAETSSAIGKVLEEKLESLIRERESVEAEIRKHSSGPPPAFGVRRDADREPQRYCKAVHPENTALGRQDRNSLEILMITVVLLR